MNILKILTPRRRLGNLGETAAARYLRRKGYWILERNFVGKWGEMDIIARKKRLLCFIEVKTRSVGAENGFEPRPAASVTAEKQRRLIRVANEYARRTYKESGCKMRMDVIEVYTEPNQKNKIKVRKLVHIENAFDMNTAYKVH